ncbi:MAG: VCBS repeat-containing protein [Verrucomicrobia bacterium]|nr:VCBS repeat-containing protein [Verrucomicrobiota bacterium]
MRTGSLLRPFTITKWLPCFQFGQLASRWTHLACLGFCCIGSATQAQQSGSAVPVPILGLTSSPIDPKVDLEMQRLDPSTDGWSTEVINEQTQDLLKTSLKALHQGPQQLREHLDKLLAPGFHSTRWRPEELAVSFTDGTLKVLKGKPNETYLRLSGSEAFMEALQTAVSPLDMSASSAWDDFQMHFKTTGVDLDGNQALTTVWVETHGHDQERRIEGHATWQCRWSLSVTAKGSPKLQSITLTHYQESQAPERNLPWFTDVTRSVFQWEDGSADPLLKGIDHWRKHLDWRFTLDVTGPHGLAVGDVNGDGREDLYLCEPGGLPNRMLIQQRDGSLQDFGTLSGTDYLEASSSALLVDLDNDLDLDLVLATGRYILTAVNDGEAHFKTLQIYESQSMFRSLTAIDIDQDGMLDIYACGYYARFGDRLGLGRPMPYHDANNGVRNLLLRNTGNGLEDITEASGLESNNHRFSYAAAWEDFDNDGDPDLYVANDFGRNNLYRNDGGHFVDVAAEAGVEDLSAGMSVSWGDYNQDGWMDLYVGNMFSSAGNRIAFQRQYRGGQPADQFQRHARGNSLFLNQGDGTFLDTSQEAGVTLGRWAWCSPFVDFNNDGWQDLLVANGMVTGTEDTGDL